MAEILTPDLCVIGAGSAGLSVAAGAVQMGASVVLIEKGAMGGDCLNYGCVPSKAMLAAAEQAAAMRGGAAFGVAPVEPDIDFARVQAHVAEVIAAIAPLDSVERFEGLGVTVIKAEARFTGPREVVAGGRTIRARRFVIATGSRPSLPPIPGLSETPHLTNETLFANRERPDHLLIIGGGPIGVEMAQAHRRLGSRVTVLEAASLLGRDDPELTAILRARLEAEGVTLRDGVAIERVAGPAGAITLTLAGGERIEGSHLLVAAGRQPVVDGLGLENAEVAVNTRGIDVDRRLRSRTNRRVFALGDVAGGPQFTHVAGYHAGIVIQNALFRLPAKVSYDAIPAVTYCDPELAQVGLTEAAARARHGADRVEVWRWSFAENDRAQAERRTEGLIKVVTRRGGRVVGAGIVGKDAGNLLQPWIFAVAGKLKLQAIARHVAPYPTLGEVSKRAAGAYYAPKLFSARTRWIVRLLAKLG
ncbi:MAG: FAD-dependent oxidoreductase [Azospirillaceae bacterium]